MEVRLLSLALMSKVENKETEMTLDSLKYAVQTFYVSSDSETSKELDAAYKTAREKNINPVEIIRAVIKGTPLEKRKDEMSKLVTDFNLNSQMIVELIKEFNLSD